MRLIKTKSRPVCPSKCGEDAWRGKYISFGPDRPKLREVTRILDRVLEPHRYIRVVDPALLISGGPIHAECWGGLDQADTANVPIVHLLLSDKQLMRTIKTCILCHRPLGYGPRFPLDEEMPYDKLIKLVFRLTPMIPIEPRWLIIPTFSPPVKTPKYWVEGIHILRLLRTNPIARTLIRQVLCPFFRQAVPFLRHLDSNSHTIILSDQEGGEV
jgi:hypothetical protein